MTNQLASGYVRGRPTILPSQIGKTLLFSIGLGFLCKLHKRL